MKKYKDFLQEAVNISNVQVGPMTSDGSLEYDDLNMTNLGDSRVIKVFNTYLASIGHIRPTDLYTVLLRVRMKLAIFGLYFDFGHAVRNLNWDDIDAIMLRIKYYGGCFDPYNGRESDGMEEWYPNGLYLFVDAKSYQPGSDIFCQMHLTSPDQEFDQEKFKEFVPYQVEVHRQLATKTYDSMKSVLEI